MTAQHGEIKIGARVFRPDGSAEHVRQVLIAPTRRQVVGLVVARGLLAPDVVEPADGITAVNEDEVEIRGRATTLIRAPPLKGM